MTPLSLQSARTHFPFFFLGPHLSPAPPVLPPARTPHAAHPASMLLARHPPRAGAHGRIAHGGPRPAFAVQPAAAAAPTPTPAASPPPPPPVVVAGIDLGTCNSAIAVVHEGKPTLLPDPDAGTPTTPSWVAVDPANPLQWRVGGAALRGAAANPANTFPMPKRLMGRKFRGLTPADLAGGAAVVEAFDGGAEWWCPARAEALAPDAVAGVLVAHLLARATRSGPGRRPVTAAVITVPARYTPAQLKATEAAGRAAGLQAVRLVPEPVAAAVAYGIGSAAAAPPSPSSASSSAATDGGGCAGGDATVLVVDVGGGTTDVAVVEAFEGMLEVLGAAGDSRLGGGDFDAAVADWLAAQHPVAALLAGAAAAAAGDEGGVAAAAVGVARMLSRVAGRVQGGGGLRAGLSGADVWASADEEDEEGGGLLPPSPSSSAHATAGGGAAALRLRGAAEAAKVTLSSSDQAAVELRLVPGGPVARVALSRARFDQLTAPLVARVVGLVTAAAAEAGVALEGGGGDKASPPPPSSPGGGDKYAPPPRRITHAILVGGGARVPAVRAAIAGVVGVEPVATIDPEACVALGAAAIAAALAGDASAGGGFELADGPYAPHLHGRASGFGVE